MKIPAMDMVTGLICSYDSAGWKHWIGIFGLSRHPRIFTAHFIKFIRNTVAAEAIEHTIFFCSEQLPWRQRSRKSGLSRPVHRPGILS